MLGYADTDLVTLFLPLLIGLAPAVWVMHFLRHPLALPFRWFQRWTKRPIPIALDAPGHQPYAPISAFWVFTLSASGCSPGGLRNGIPCSRTSCAIMWP